MTYRSLLVPLDGSPFSEQALPLAVSIARRAGASFQVAVVAVRPWFSYLSSKECLDHWSREWRAYLERIVEQMRSHGANSVSSVLLKGNDVAPRICAHAESIGADLIVMTSHGRGALGQFWLGSVSYGVMHRWPRPLLLVRPGDSLAEWGNDAVPRHMLVPLDGSAAAERMIEPAISLGSLMDADYTLLRVINDIPFGTPELDSVSLSSPSVELLDEIQSIEKRVQKEAQDYLDGVAGGLRARGLRVQTRVTVANDPAAVILEKAADPGIDLVALWINGPRGVSDLVVGRVARKVIHGTRKPILVQSAASATRERDESD